MSFAQSCDAEPLLKPRSADHLASSYLSYPQVCDELLSEVRSRLVSNGAATKLDLGALVFWKHINNAPWMTALMKLPDTVVRAATARAFAAGLADEERLSALAPLHGCGFGGGGAITSVLFAAWDPQSYGVYDKFAASARANVTSTACACDWSHLPTYWSHLRRIATELQDGGGSWTPRMVDMALFGIGNPRGADTDSWTRGE